VYSGENEHLILKSVDEIEQSLKGYLTGVVARYNQPLKDQLAKSTSYYNSHKAAFDTLAVSDQSASPHRQYEPLDEKFFVDYLGEGAIRAIAELLYRQNLPWKYKTAEKNVLDDLSSSLLSTDINSKIRAVMQEYLVTHESFNSISMP